MRILLTTLHSKFIHTSLALPCLATFSRETSDCEILIREFTVHEPKEQIVAAILEESPRIVAFSVYIWNRRPTLDVVDAIAAADPAVQIVLGGPEISFDGPELFENHPGVRGLIRGEGEVPFREFLQRQAKGNDPAGIPRTLWRTSGGLVEGPWSPPLANLDAIPSPFSAGMIDLFRGFVYLETSRGCPYRCSFCMSSLDDGVRSFSMERIRSDLSILMTRQIPKIKLVDRTFNYDPARAREIFAFILANNRSSHFHFEIGANLLDQETLRLLEQVPEGMFQFEIGVQSTSLETLKAIRRPITPKTIRDNLVRLRQKTRISLHLDLIAGLPGEGYERFLTSIDQILALKPHHLQVEPVKLLPGSPLRHEAKQRGIRHDPNPPYTVLTTPHLSFLDLERLRGISRLLDTIYNSSKFREFFDGLTDLCGFSSQALARLEKFWRHRGLFRFPLRQRDVFARLRDFVREGFGGGPSLVLQELLALDLARCERPTGGGMSPLFTTTLTVKEKTWIQEKIRVETAKSKGKGIKTQHFAAVFSHIPRFRPRTAVLFIYRTRTGKGMTVEEILLDDTQEPPQT